MNNDNTSSNQENFTNQTSKIGQWSKIRTLLNALTFFGILAVLIQVLLSFRAEEKKTVANFDFPANVPLSGWEQIQSTPLKPPQENLDPGQNYQYRHQNEPLDIQVRYQKYTDSNMSRFLMLYADMRPGAVLSQPKYKEGFGYYNLFEYEDKAYLTACLNPKGESTVSNDQFTKNRYRHTMGLQRTLLWIIGQQDLTDGRCLWTLISLPVPDDPNENTLENENLEPTYQKLEKAWFDWYQWWKPKLPPY